jgi:hypothetical protein
MEFFSRKKVLEFFGQNKRAGVFSKFISECFWEKFSKFVLESFWKKVPRNFFEKNL